MGTLMAQSPEVSGCFGWRIQPIDVDLHLITLAGGLVIVDRSCDAFDAVHANAVLPHQSLQPLLAHTYALVAQLTQNAWTTVAATSPVVHGLEMHQQGVVTQVAAWCRARLVRGNRSR